MRESHSDNSETFCGTALGLLDSSMDIYRVEKVIEVVDLGWVDMHFARSTVLIGQLGTLAVRAEELSKIDGTL